MENFKVYQVTYHGPTYSKGSRVKIYDVLREKSRMIPFSSQHAYTIDVAEAYFKEKGIEMIGHGETKNGYVFFTRDFGSEI